MGPGLCLLHARLQQVHLGQQVGTPAAKGECDECDVWGSVMDEAVRVTSVICGAV